METPSSHRRHTTAGARAKARRIIADTWQSQANLSLFLALVVCIGFVFPALGVGRNDLRLYGDLGTALMLISGVAIAWGHRTLMLLTGAISIATIAVRWIDWVRPGHTVQIWVDVTSIASLLAIVFVLLFQVLSRGRVTHVRIQGAIAAYLLLGIVWAYGYHLVNVLHPGSFNGAATLSTFADWAYYSYVTLSTVGYGDITPATSVARIVSVGEALTGQLYLAVLIARLVAMEVIFWQETAAKG